MQTVRSFAGQRPLTIRFEVLLMSTVLRRYRIGARLNAGFAALLLLVVLMVALALNSLRGIHATVEAIVTEAVKAKDADKAADADRKPGPRVVKIVSFSKSGNHRATVKKVKVFGNERVTPGGLIKRKDAGEDVGGQLAILDRAVVGAALGQRGPGRGGPPAVLDQRVAGVNVYTGVFVGEGSLGHGVGAQWASLQGGKGGRTRICP